MFNCFLRCLIISISVWVIGQNVHVLYKRKVYLHIFPLLFIVAKISTAFKQHFRAQLSSFLYLLNV